MDYIEINKQAWEQRTKIHIESEFYDVKGFLAGKSSLNPIELEQLGDVSGKSLLHLQCHFGLDTLSWARLGAKVTGVDLSAEAITQAQKLAEQLELDATFICDDVYQFGEHNSQQFDLVFVSYGALCWLPDLDRWAQTIEKALKPGGQVHIIEFHTFNDLLSGYRYFPHQAPDIENEGTYTENCTGETAVTHTWSHPLSEVISALLNAGIQLEEFKEFPYSPYNCFDGLELIENKGYQLLHQGQQVPLVYALKGRK